MIKKHIIVAKDKDKVKNILSFFLIIIYYRKNTIKKFPDINSIIFQMEKILYSVKRNLYVYMRINMLKYHILKFADIMFIF